MPSRRIELCCHVDDATPPGFKHGRRGVSRLHCCPPTPTSKHYGISPMMIPSSARSFSPLCRRRRTNAASRSSASPRRQISRQRELRSPAPDRTWPALSADPCQRPKPDYGMPSRLGERSRLFRCPKLEVQLFALLPTAKRQPKFSRNIEINHAQEMDGANRSCRRSGRRLVQYRGGQQVVHLAKGPTAAGI